MKKPSGLGLVSWMLASAVLMAACAGSDVVTGNPGSGGSSTGSAGSGNPGAAGSSTPGSGGSSTPGSGGSSTPGTGGTSTPGTGGTSTGSGGTSTPGTGGTATGSGGTSTPGTGGTSTGTGGTTTGTGGAATGTAGRGGTTGTGGTGGGTGAAGSAGSAGTSGRGGTTGTAGASGATGTAGASGRGGTTGTAGASGTTGTGGTGPAPTEVFVAPDGNDSNPGTMAQPLKSVCDTTAKAGACYKLCPSSYSCPASGATIWMRGGTYTISGTAKIDIGAIRAGSASASMNIFAYNGEKPVIDAAGLTAGNTTGIAMHIKGSYWHVKGIEIKNAPYNCIKIEGGGNTIENTVVHNCGNTGLTLTAYGGEDMSVGPPGSNNLILNVDSYNNIATNGDGEDADGFGAKKSMGTGNIFRGCRAWYNADDGFDFYGWMNPITIENSWAIDSNRRNAPNGDGNGFKMGKGPGNHILKDTLAVNNTKYGYTNNGADNTSSCTNCRGCGNSSGLNDSGSRALSGSVTNLSPCPSVTTLEAARKADGSLPSF